MKTKTYTELESEIADWTREAHQILDSANGDLSADESARFDQLQQQIRDNQAEQGRLNHAHDMALGAVRGAVVLEGGSAGARGGGAYDRDPVRDYRDSATKFRGRNP